MENDGLREFYIHEGHSFRDLVSDDGNTTGSGCDDGYVSHGCGGDDCDDADPMVNPGGTEGPAGHPSCSDGVTDGSDLGCMGHNIAASVQAGSGTRGYLGLMLVPLVGLLFWRRRVGRNMPVRFCHGFVPTDLS